MKSKKQSNKEFLEKIKTIGISTGGKKPEACPSCGEDHGEMKLIGVGVGIIRRSEEAPKPRDDSQESAFAA